METTLSQHAPAMERGDRSRAFLLSRITLIIATAYMVIAQSGLEQVSPSVLALIVVGLASGIAAFRLPVGWFASTTVNAGVLVADTGWITAVLLASGRFEAEFFYLYFFILFIAAIGERLALIALGAVVVSAAYLYAMSASGGQALLDTSSLIRIPFLLTVATFYGYLVDRVRREQRKTREEAASVRRLEEVRTNLEASNERLEAEVRERRRAEQEVRKLSRAVEQSPAIVFITDINGVVEYANARFSTVTGIPTDAAVGRDLRELCSDRPGHEQPEIADVLDAGTGWRGEIRSLRADGESFWASTSISPLRDGQGRHTHFIAVQEDITDRKQAELSLREANTELARVSEMKSAFVSIVSHELRTPLTSIKNGVDLVRSGRAGALEPDQQRFLDMSTRNLDRLAMIIDDLLDLSKIEAGRFDYHFRSASACEVLEEVANTFRPQAQKSNISLELEAAPDLPDLLLDPGRLGQVVSNLVGNALKFTGKGGTVTLGARRHRGPGGGGEEVVLEVTDTGSGIQPEEIGRIFDAFHQTGDCLTRSVRGTGLGLSIARELAWAHGGEITADSRPGEGSVFRVHLPANPERARERVELEEILRRQRKFPFTGLLVVRWAEGNVPTALEPSSSRRSILSAVRDTLRETLPRESDLVLVQAAHRRLVVVLQSTPRGGSETVRQRLQAALRDRAIRIDGESLAPPLVLGPGMYPEDGATARALVGLITKSATDETGRQRSRPRTEGETDHDEPTHSGSGRRARRSGDDPLPTPAGGLRGIDSGERPGSSGDRPLLPA